MPQINGGRLLADLRRLAEFGAYKSGVHRPTFSPQDIEARRWLAGRFTEAGLEASIDGIGNVFGRSRATGPKLLIGSHTESQNHAGWLDGALGVMYGLEVARAFSEDPRTAGCRDRRRLLGGRGRTLRLFSWKPLLHWRRHATKRSTKRATTMMERLFAKRWRRQALRRRRRETIVASDYIGYLEAHIEQGDTLDEAGLRLGVVTGIVGIRQYRIVFVGEANHAGTTRMVTAQGRERRAHQTVRCDCGAFLTGCRTSQRLDHRRDPRRAWPAQHRSGTRRDDVPGARHRGRAIAAL